MLSDLLKQFLASTYAYTVKAQMFHWNIEGPDFAQMHKFFQEIYDDAYDAIDPTAEYIRTLDEYAPGSFERFMELSIISGQTKIPRTQLMLEELLGDTDAMINLANQTFAAAEAENQQAIADFMAGRLSSHGKYRWQLKSFLKGTRA
jgi:starvation-inducible DNA-binding protein